MSKRKGLDISKLAEKLNQLNQNSGGNQGGGMNFLNINDGRNVLRILPPRPGEEDFYLEVWVHYGVGKSDSNKKGTMVVCPKTHGEDKDCPVCELSQQFYDLSTKKDDSYSKQAKSYYRKKRVYYNAISRDEDLSVYKAEEQEDGTFKWTNTKTDEEESPIKVLGTGVGVFKDILKLIVDPEYGDITDFDEGLDLIIEKSGSGQYNTSYDVRTVRKESPAIPDDAPVELLENWEDMLIDLSPLAKAKTYDEIAKIMDGGEDTEDDPEEDNSSEDNTSNSSVDVDEEDDMEAELREAMARRRNKK